MWLDVPRLRPDAVNRASRVHESPGGKGINVSRVLAALRQPTVALAIVGGQVGRTFGARLRGVGLPSILIRIPGETRRNYHLQSRRPSVLLKINTPGPQVTREAIRRLERHLRILPLTDVILSGSLPPGLPLSTYARLIRLLACRRVRVVVDTSGPALRRSLSAKPWLIKPNREEAEALLGMRLTSRARVAEAAWSLVRRGPQAVLLSLGGDGAVLARRGNRLLWAKPPRVAVRSSVGAGDALAAGFVAGHRLTGSFAEALRLGVACGTAAAMTSGPQLCRRAEVERLIPRIRLRTI